ncbi:uncharacterized protein LOC143022480 [Oratosquilla oratoria]|uniref:uncharacterized protein LOC143022480 n=1 Tax=Oratosquilla oratoria TaxID=337810 RepID=UPI003F768DBA
MYGQETIFFFCLTFWSVSKTSMGTSPTEDVLSSPVDNVLSSPVDHVLSSSVDHVPISDSLESTVPISNSLGSSPTEDVLSSPVDYVMSSPVDHVLSSSVDQSSAVDDVLVDCDMCDQDLVVEDSVLSVNKDKLVGGGNSKPPVFFYSDKMVSTSLLTEILSNLEQFPIDKLSHTPPVKACGGELFVFVGKEGDWKADQYQWRMKGQRKFFLPGVNLLVQKRYDWVHGEEDFVSSFTRTVYTCASVFNVVLIQYLGDNSVYKGKAHGNSKHPNAPEFRRTCPSVLDKMKEKVISKSSDKVYQELVTNATDSAYQGVLNPRNVTQVKNIKKAVNAEWRLSKDDLYNTVQLAYHLKDFVHQVTVYPDLVCIVGVKCLLDELDKVLQGSPVIPAGFLIHERKFQQVHKQFFSMMKEHVTHLQKDSLHVPIVVDRETGITNAIEIACPSFDIFHCWNHIRRDWKFWLRSHGATSDDVEAYSDNLSSLLSCESESKFDELVQEMLPKWSEAMVEHFNSSLKNELKTYSRRWVLDKAKNFHVSEVQRGLAGIGNYRLKQKFQYAAIDVEDINIPESVCHPDEIVSLVKGEIELGLGDACHDEKQVVTNSDGSKEITEDQISQDRPNVSSQRSLALDVLKRNGVVHVPSLSAFMVHGSKGDKYAVSLFLKEKCQCPSTSTCYHIIAAKMSVGLHTACKEKTYNLSQLRRNSRKGSDKKSGRKRPRPLDYDNVSVTPAPDSSIALDRSACVTDDMADDLIGCMNDPWREYFI